MIPKIIHYCWLSGDEYPEHIQQCIHSWKQKLPDYEIVLWDLNRFDLKQSKWVKQAYKSRKYAFAADYIRFYALYHYGGIYLDSDVEVLKPFNDLLSLPYFIGKEKSSRGGIEAAVLGAEKGLPWIGRMLDYYKGRDFEYALGKFDTTELPFIMKNLFAEQGYTVNDIETPRDFVSAEKTINRLPVDFFSPKDWKTKETQVTGNTYCIHHFDGTWQKTSTFWERMRRYCGKIKKICNA